jgi:hypothetical protein
LVVFAALFLSCRAAVRAKTSATAAKFQNDARRRGELQALAREYLAMAEGLLHPPRLVSSQSEGCPDRGNRYWRSDLRHRLVPRPALWRFAVMRSANGYVGSLLERLGPGGLFVTSV